MKALTTLLLALACSLASAATPNPPIRVTGMVVRTVAGNDLAEAFAAICVRCPHEGCDVEFVRDANQLPPEVKGEIGRPVTGSVYVCPCHNSTFAANDGSRLAGPAPRGLYRFKVTGVMSITQYINGVVTGDTIATANIPVVAIYPSFVCQSAGTNDPIMHLRGYRIFQLR